MLAGQKLVWKLMESNVRCEIEPEQENERKNQFLENLLSIRVLPYMIHVWTFPLRVAYAKDQRGGKSSKKTSFW
jgi:hypothetical protein